MLGSYKPNTFSVHFDESDINIRLLAFINKFSEVLVESKIKLEFYPTHSKLG